jgi:hypothetical protein
VALGHYDIDILKSLDQLAVALTVVNNELGSYGARGAALWLEIVRVRIAAAWSQEQNSEVFRVD